MLFDNYRSIKDYKKIDRKSDLYSNEDIIDRTGYVPLDVQYYRMMSSGINLTRAIDDQFNFDWKELEQSYMNNTLDVSEVSRDRINKRFMDRSQLYDEGVRLLEKYNKAKTDSEKLSTIRDKYLKDREIEEIRKEAINTYIADQKSRKLTE